MSRRIPSARAAATALVTSIVALSLTATGATVVAADAAPGRATPAHAAPAKAAANPVTPGDFTGYGFDQCVAPTQKSMNAWLDHSPFLGVGIYIAGESRGCRNQPNLTPTWIRTQLAKGWRLLPITLGPQASCNPRFPRYGNDETINPKPGGSKHYGKARRQARQEATRTVAEAQRLGIVPGSTLWYDLEAYNSANGPCRESALYFLSAWTNKLHRLGYVSGVYSSAGSGIKDLDNARVNRPGKFAMPDQVWVARWSGAPGRINDSGHTYLRNDGWMPHARVHQYQGGHDESWGGVRINIDRNWLDVGKGSVSAAETHCGGVRVSWPKYPGIKPATDTRTPDPARVKALQCLLTEKKVYTGKINGIYNAKTVAAANKWQAAHGLAAKPTFSKKSWMTLLVDGLQPVLKVGSSGPEVRRLQRTLNAAGKRSFSTVTGVFSTKTQAALRAWQDHVGLRIDGIANATTWAALRNARR